MKILDEREDERLIELHDGEKIKLTASDDLTITISSITKKVMIGEFDFNFIDDDNGGFYKLTYMFLDKTPGYTYRGIGTACIQYCLDYTDSVIFCGQANGMEADDGSHLTGDGESFAMKMIEKGLIKGQM